MELLNTAQAAKYIGYARSTLYRLARDGKVPSHRMGWNLVFIKSELDAWLASR